MKETTKKLIEFIWAMSVAIGSMVSLIIILVIMSFQNYRVVLESDHLFEHYLELVVLVIGFLLFIHVFKKRFIRPKA